MLNEFVSVVISGNEEHRKLMEMTCLVRRQLPVALIEVCVFNKQGETHKTEPWGDEGEGAACLCTVCNEFVCVYIGCVCMIEYTECVWVCVASVGVGVCFCVWSVYIVEMHCIFI